LHISHCCCHHHQQQERQQHHRQLHVAVGVALSVEVDAVVGGDIVAVVANIIAAVCNCNFC